ncbi:MAG: helix-turn-helix domain-containing protein [Xanthobacteraceae bacterium]
MQWEGNLQRCRRSFEFIDGARTSRAGARGLDKANRQLARSLNISTETVKTHLKNILARLDVEQRWQAAELARPWARLTNGDAAPRPVYQPRNETSWSLSDRSAPLRDLRKDSFSPFEPSVQTGEMRPTPARRDRGCFASRASRLLLPSR